MATNTQLKEQRNGDVTRDKALQNAKPLETIACGGGLVLYVSAKGTKIFRLRYRIAGKPYIYTIGKYGSDEGQISLSQARIERDRIKDQIRQGINPSLERKKDKLQVKAKIADSFEEIAHQWFELQKDKRALVTNKRNLGRFVHHVFPLIGYMPIADIEPSHLYGLFGMLKDKPETAQKTKHDMRRIFSYALLHKKIKRNPVNDVELREILNKKEEQNMPFLFEEELPDFFNAVYSQNHSLLSILAFHLSALTFLRSGTLRRLKWKYVNIEDQQLIIPAEEMKVKRPHLVPISKQTQLILDKVKQLGFQSEYVFPSTGKKRHISEHRILSVIYKSGYKGKMSIHGWRHSFSTIANETMKFNPDAIEIQLHHSTKSTNKIRATYNKAEYVEERTKLMQWWGDKLEEIGARFNLGGGL